MSQGGPGSRRQAGRGTSRREFIGTAAAAGSALAAAKAQGAAKAARSLERRGSKRRVAGMNTIIFLTDQDRAIQHFPKGWRSRNLPGFNRLAHNGLMFTNAFCNACMCSPARSTLMTGYFPAQHGVKYTLELDMPSPQYPQVEMPTDLPNIATVAKAAGYKAVYKGKWHLNKPEGDLWAPSDVAKYGFERWNPQDAGANQDIPEAGGGWPNNDGRFMQDDGPVEEGREGALAYLRSQAAQDQPFLMVISLVNPHDVLFYPKTYKDAGYTDEWLEGGIDLPETVNEDLSTKPSVQAQFVRLFDLSGKLTTPQMKRNYLNFYGNLLKVSDAFLVEVLDTLEETNLLDDTLVIRTADHGEMGLAHGGMRQKNFNVYEETMRVPMVYSNPRLFPKRVRSKALVSHVDFLPTLASLLEVPDSARADWQGRDYSKVVLDPNEDGPQDYTVFTWDDWQAGQAQGPYLPPPNHIVSIREKRWKLAKYYDLNGEVEPQWEMYDLKNDPLERNNLARPGYKRSPVEQKNWRRLRRRLRRVRERRLAPLT